jgi:hypothetical protein
VLTKVMASTGFGDAGPSTGFGAAPVPQYAQTHMDTMMDYTQQHTEDPSQSTDHHILPETSPRTRAVKYKVPDEYHGDRGELETFLLQCELYISGITKRDSRLRMR